MTTTTDARPAFTHRFRHRGRSYTIFKRKKTNDAHFYIRLQRHKEFFKQTLETNQKEAAIARAKDYIDAVLDGRWSALKSVKVRSGVSTLAEVLAVYRSKAGIKRASIRNNVSSLLLLLKYATGGEVNPERFSLTQLSGDLIFKFQEAMRQEYAAAAAKDDTSQRSAREKSYRSSFSIIKQARSVFADNHDLRKHYQMAGIVLPENLNEFREAQTKGKAVKREYLCPPDSVIDRTFREIEKLAKTDPNCYKAFWVAVGAGLRKNEIGKLKFEHFVMRSGEMWISGGIGKDNEQIEVPLQSKAVKKLTPFMQPQGRFIEEYVDRWAARLNAWMVKQGWQTEKKLHELRAYVGSLIYQINPVAAMKFMRHKSIKVTEDFYVRYSTRTKQVDVL